MPRPHRKSRLDGDGLHRREPGLLGDLGGIVGALTTALGDVGDAANTLLGGKNNVKSAPTPTPPPQKPPPSQPTKTSSTPAAQNTPPANQDPPPPNDPGSNPSTTPDPGDSSSNDSPGDSNNNGSVDSNSSSQTSSATLGPIVQNYYASAGSDSYVVTHGSTIAAVTVSGNVVFPIPTGTISGFPHAPTNSDGTPWTGDNGDPNVLSAKKGGISGGAIGAIVAFIVVAIGAAIVFFLRRRHARQRDAQRTMWGKGLFASGPNRNSVTSISSDTSFESPHRIRSYYDTVAQPERSHSPTHVKEVPEMTLASPMANRISFPPPSLTAMMNPPDPSASKPHAVTITAPSSSGHDHEDPFADTPDPFADGLPPPPPTPGPPLTPQSHPPTPDPGRNRLVISLYTISQPDELPIHIGDTIQVVSEHDDGWALCQDSNGSRGFVPMSCLEGGPSATSKAQRESSLYAQ
jgi:hypothetical protein